MTTTNCCSSVISGWKVARIGRPKNNHEINFVGGQRRHRPFVVDHLHVERHQRMGLAEFGDLARQEIERQRLAAGDAYGAATQSFQILDLRFHALDFAVLPAQIMDKDFAGSGESDAARTPVE